MVGRNTAEKEIDGKPIILGRKELEDFLPHRRRALPLKKGWLEIKDGKVIANAVFYAHPRYFKGHFPGDPVLPGHILQEACCQTSALLFPCSPANQVRLVSVNVEFKEEVKPGQTVLLRAWFTREGSVNFRIAGEAICEGGKVLNLEKAMLKIVPQIEKAKKRGLMKLIAALARAFYMSISFFSGLPYPGSQNT